MKLYMLARRANVKARWQDVNNTSSVQLVDTLTLDTTQFDTDACLFVHLEALDKKELTQVLALREQIKLVAFSDTPSDSEGMEMLVRGFRGYINTFVSRSIFAEMLQIIARGDIWAGPAIVQKLLKQMLAQHNATVIAADNAPAAQLDAFDLSEREEQVVMVLIEGASNKQIARELDITERTVKAHVSSILKKTDTTDRLSLILKLKNQQA